MPLCTEVTGQVCCSTCRDLSTRTWSVIEGLNEILIVHNADQDIISDFDDQLLEYMSTCENEGEFMEKIKYFLCVFMALYLKNELPPCKIGPPGLPLHGRVRRWFNVRLKSFSRSNTNLFFSIFKAKTCAQSVSGDFIASSYREHVASLTLPDPLEGESNNGLFDELTTDETFVYALNLVKGKFLALYGGDETAIDGVGIRGPCDNEAPSASSCFNNTIASGGASEVLRAKAGLRTDECEELGLNNSIMVEDDGSYFGTIPGPGGLELSVGESQRSDILNDLGIFDDRQPDPLAYCGEALPLPIQELVSMKWYPLVFKGGRYHSNYIESIYEHTGREEWGRLFRSYNDSEPRELPKAKIHAIPEPLKVRVISKGDPGLYYSVKKAQKCLNLACRSLPCFRLMGRKECPTDLFDLAERAEMLAKAGHADIAWHSIDYKSATDRLSARLGTYILSYLISDLEASVQSRILKVFGFHDLYYPAERGIDDESCCFESIRLEKEHLPPGETVSNPHVCQFCRERLAAHNGEYYTITDTSKDYLCFGTQTNGQLMGSPISFPILCLSNLALALRVTRLEDWISRSPLRMGHHVADSGRFTREVLRRIDNGIHYDRLRSFLINGDDLLYVGTQQEWIDHIELGKRVGLSLSIGKAYRHHTYANINSLSIHHCLKGGGGYGTRETPYAVPYFAVGLFFDRHKLGARSGPSALTKHRDLPDALHKICMRELFHVGSRLVGLQAWERRKFPNNCLKQIEQSLRVLKEEIKPIFKIAELDDIGEAIPTEMFRVIGHGVNQLFEKFRVLLYKSLTYETMSGSKKKFFDKRFRRLLEPAWIDTSTEDLIDDWECSVLEPKSTYREERLHENFYTEEGVRYKSYLTDAEARLKFSERDRINAENRANRYKKLLLEYKAETGREFHLAIENDIPFHVNIPNILEGVPLRFRELVMNKILVMHRKRLQLEATALYTRENKDGFQTTSFFIRNLFLPISAGGLGICPPMVEPSRRNPEGVYKFYVTPIQKAVAHSIRSSIYAKNGSIQLPLPGLEPFQASFSDPPWVKKKVKPMVTYEVHRGSRTSFDVRQDLIEFCPIGIHRWTRL